MEVLKDTFFFFMADYVWPEISPLVCNFKWIFKFHEFLNNHIPTNFKN